MLLILPVGWLILQMNRKLNHFKNSLVKSILFVTIISISQAIAGINLKNTRVFEQKNIKFSRTLIRDNRVIPWIGRNYKARFSNNDYTNTRITINPFNHSTNQPKPREPHGRSIQIGFALQAQRRPARSD